MEDKNVTEHETLQNTFKRLELQDQQKQAKAETQKENLGACGYAKKDPSLLDGRLCGLQDRLYCENWGKLELVAICPVLKKYGITLEKEMQDFK